MVHAASGTSLAAFVGGETPFQLSLILVGILSEGATVCLARTALGTRTNAIAVTRTP